jgi:3-oxoacyl-[acyl-carrier-protein] synthase-3
MNLFHMKGPSIFKMGARLLTPFLDDFFRSIELDRSRFDSVVPHQASRHAIEMLTKNGFTHDQLVMNLPTRGNCIAASIPLALAEAVESGRIRRGNNIILVGSGAGFTLGATALTY